MRRWWPYIFVLLICLPAAAPYLGGDIPRSNDSLAHLYRAVELDRLVRSGVWFPRWAPGLAHGYGYPIFDYFAYFSHTLIVLFHLIGLPMLTALRAAYVAALLGSGVTAFLLGRELAGGDGEQAGVVAAAAYVYSPYLLYTAHVRGGLPESLALAFLPLALWGTLRALRLRSSFVFPELTGDSSPRRRQDREGFEKTWRPSRLCGSISAITARVQSGPAVIAALAIAGFIFSHIGMALQYLPIIGVFGLYLILSSPRNRDTDRSNDFSRSAKTATKAQPATNTRVATTSLLRDVLNIGSWKFEVGSLKLGFGILFSIFALALGLTAFLWLPAVAELRFTQFETAFARAGLTYRDNFFQFHELFAYPRLPVYADLLNPPVVRALPLVAVIISLIGLFRLRSLARALRAHYLFFFFSFLLTAFLVTDFSKPFWDAIGLLQRSTFPWRFLGPATLFAAVAAGGAVGNGKWEVGSAKWEVRSGKWGVGILILGFGIFALPFLYPPREPAPENPSRADLAKFEIPPLLVGTTTTGEYTPIWVAQFPDTSAQQAELISGREPERLQIPASAVMEHLSARPADDVYRLSADEPFTAVYRSFYFPGWQVKMDGESAPIKITYPNGLISFDVPAGEHTVEVRFGTTPVRVAAGAVSGIALLVVCALFVLQFVSVMSLRAAKPREVSETVSEIPRACPERSRRAARNDMIALLLLTGVLYLFIFVVKPVVRSGPPEMQHTLEMDFGGELLLHGYTVEGNTITLAWQAEHAIGVPYGMNIRLADDAGLIWSDTNIERPRDWRFIPGTDFWPTDKFVYDSYVLRPLRGAPPGPYHLEVIVYRADNVQALSVQRIGEYVIARPANELLAMPLADFDGVALLSVESDRAQANPGDPYRLTLLWQAANGGLRDQNVQLDLVDGAGKSAHTITAPVSPGYPPSQWKMGDVLRQDFFLRLPAGLAQGKLTWQVNGIPGIGVGVNGLTRSFTIPAVGRQVNVAVGDSLLLVGYTARISDRQINIDLVWQARAETAESYRAFLHLLDADGTLVSQSDGEPANWSRPTSGWLTGEVITDSRALTAPGPGEYTLAAGMVNEAGERLAAAGWPEGAIRLGVIAIAP